VPPPPPLRQRVHTVWPASRRSTAGRHACVRAPVGTNHSYATGGSNSGECWQAPRDLGNFLDDQTEESCTQYNILKVARRRCGGRRVLFGGRFV
jgi:DUF1680 family protein